MITIQQSGYSMTGLGDLVSRFSKSRLILDKTAIDDDISRIRDKIKTTGISKSHKNNLEQIQKYLENLSKTVDSEGGIELTWKYTKGRLSCSPISLLNCRPYKINAVDYINVGCQTLFQIDYKDVYELIAFEMMYRDIGETHESMEERLKNIGILTVSPSRIITDIFDGESPVEMSRYMKISDSPYATDNGRLSWDYFYSAGGEQTAFQSMTYKECTDKTFEIITLILTKSILGNFIKCGIQAQVCAIDTDGFYIISTPDSREAIEKNLDSVVVRIFGRKFEVKPKIRTF